MKLPLLFALLALVLVNSACAARVVRQIDDAERDRRGQFDGSWLIRSQKAPNVQQIGRDRFLCSAEAFDVPVVVEDGVMNVRGKGGTYRTNVADDGRFRLEIPATASYRRSRGVSDNKSNITYIVQGSLAAEVRSGSFTVGTARLNNHGCEAMARFEPMVPKTFRNSYRGMTSGSETETAVLKLHGEPDRREQGRYVYDEGFEIFFEPATGRIGSMIITDPTYVDPNGLRVGASRKDVDVKSRANARNVPVATDFEKGIVYWFDEDDVVARVVLASELLVPASAAGLE